MLFPLQNLVPSPYNKFTFIKLTVLSISINKNPLTGKNVFHRFANNTFTTKGKWSEAWVWGIILQSFSSQLLFRKI